MRFSYELGEREGIELVVDGEWSSPYALREEPLKLTEQELEHVAFIHELNRLWFDFISREIEAVGEDGVDDTFFDSIDPVTAVRDQQWLELLIQLNEITAAFLTSIEGSPEDIGILLQPAEERS
ncbi:hypothetical protein M3212_13335 [Alkalihalobacillus oceani]|uniref:hypothetical protein n=1 Tax=Halalkalibacter oceani TaxID=1653776 RepID=UPI00203B27A4|nr:hypothetical protein [Halalkalibacter oceani]MCM3761755.1 hypothetical protein [Halalkalibacter oceani]